MLKKKKHKDKKKKNNPNIKKTIFTLKWTFFKNKWVVSFIVFLVLTLATILRLVYLSQLKGSDYYFFSPHPGDDIYMYVNSAKQIIDGDFLELPFYYNPLYYYYLALNYILFGYNLYYPRLIQLIGGVIICFITYLIGKRVFSQAVGIISALLCAVCGTLIFHEGVLLSTALTTLFAIISIFFFIRGESDLKWINFISGGIFLGLTTLSQPNTILFLPFILIWMLIVLRIPLKQIVVRYLIILVVFFITISPVTIRNYLTSGKFILLTTSASFNFWKGNNEHATGIEDVCQPYLNKLEKEMKKEGKNLFLLDVLRFIKKDPIAFVKLQIKKCFLFWGYWDIPHQISYEIAKDSNSLLRLPFIVTFGELAILGLTGLFLSLFQYRKSLLLSLFLLIYSFSVIGFIVVGRYRPPVIPPLTIFGGFTIYFMLENLREWKWKRVSVALILLVIFSGIIHYQVFCKKITIAKSENAMHYIKTETRYILRDSSDEWHGGKSARLNSPNVLLKKEFIINEDMSQIKEGAIVLKLGSRKTGKVVISMNQKVLAQIACKDFFISGAIQGERLLGSVRVLPVSADCFRKGINVVTLQVVDGGAIAVPIDNFYNDRRSYFSNDNGTTWEKVEGEYMMDLEIIKSSAK